MKEVKPAAMKIKAAAMYLNMSPNKLRELSDLGEIPCRRLNRERYFTVKDLDNWILGLPLWVEHSEQDPERK